MLISFGLVACPARTDVAVLAVGVGGGLAERAGALMDRAGGVDEPVGCGEFVSGCGDALRGRAFGFPAGGGDPRVEGLCLLEQACCRAIGSYMARPSAWSRSASVGPSRA